jgi:DNA-binding NtrC family response regulator
MERPLALVVDKDAAVRAIVRDVFEEHNVMVLGAGSAPEAREFLRSRPIGILMVDFATPGVDELELLARGRELQHAPTLVSIVPDSDPSRGAALLRSGAFDVLLKPVDESTLQRVVHRALVQHKTRELLRHARQELQSREGYHGVVGRSEAMERLRERLRELGRSGVSPWFVGEPGTGKELAARSLHGLSPSAGAAFVAVPCAELTGEGWDERWFGADGLLAQAEGGTLYLEDLTALSPELQELLIAVLAPGADSDARSVRFVAGSQIDPRDAIEQGRLLVEVRDALDGEVLVLPPLRERSGDIALLARHFVSAICEINYLPSLQLAPEAVSLMERYRWPHNVQELRNAMEHAVILSSDGRISPRELPDRVRESGALEAAPVAVAVEGVSARGFREAKREIVEIFERGYLRELMARHGGNVTAASQQAGMLRSALQRLLRKYQLKSADFRDRRRPEAATEAASRTTVE